MANLVTPDGISKLLLRERSSVIPNTIVVRVVQLKHEEGDTLTGYVDDGSDRLDLSIALKDYESKEIMDNNMIQIFEYRIIDLADQKRRILVTKYKVIEPIVGLIYDAGMLDHSNPSGDNQHAFPEIPERLTAVWGKLQENLASRCLILPPKQAEDEEILLVHGRTHVKKVSSLTLETAGLDSVYFNGTGSKNAAYLAAGCTIEAVKSVVLNLCNSAMAIVRPPGHHALKTIAKGFCIFNNVAIAATYILQNPKYAVRKILVVDWDVHHGNGTQKIFWNDSRVLFFSIHRHDDGQFYPCGQNGSYDKIGGPQASGFNVNIPFDGSEERLDADYLAVWDNILLPIANEFKPDLVLISAGFDAAHGDAMGDFHVTPYGYACMLQKLMHLANGKIVLALEGGYSLDATANSVEACVGVLLGDQPVQCAPSKPPFKSTMVLIKQVRDVLKPFWRSLNDESPKPEPKIDAPIIDSALIPNTWVSFKLQHSQNVNKDTQMCRFSFDPNKKFGLYVGSCILLRATPGQGAETIIRPYTPVSDIESKGYFDLLIKVHRKGKMSQHITSLKPGDTIEVKGPIDKLKYAANMKKNIGMIAGGLGVTPMLQVIEAILNNSRDRTQISLIYSNFSPDEISLKEELDNLAKCHPNIKVFYTVDKPTETWKGGAGAISKDMIIKGLPHPCEDTLVLVCGPPGMLKRISGEKAKDSSQGKVSGILKDLGYTEEMVYKF